MDLYEELVDGSGYAVCPIENIVATAHYKDTGPWMKDVLKTI